jgi:crotonobetainyl-CoA:carnitine CoA-transferase CaiB-like acyl-CoA transferase
MEHREFLQELMGAWCSTRILDEVVAIFEEVKDVVGSVFDMSDIADDPHYAARSMIQVVGDTPMQGLIAALSKTPGVLQHEGSASTADRYDIAANSWRNE